MIFKSIAAQVEAINEAKGEVEAYGAAFDNLDSDGDIIDPGSALKTIKERGPEGSNRIKALWMHDWWEPIGTVLHIGEDSHGIIFKYVISATRMGKDVLANLLNKTLTENSIGLDILARKTEEGEEHHITELRLWDISPVTWGANPLTPNISVKMENGETYDPLKRYKNNIRRLLQEPINETNYEGLVLSLAALDQAGALFPDSADTRAKTANFGDLILKEFQNTSDDYAKLIVEALA